MASFKPFPFLSFQRRFYMKRGYVFMFKCLILLKLVPGGVDGRFNFPVPFMSRLNQTEPTTVSILPSWAFFRDSVFSILWSHSWYLCRVPRTFNQRWYEPCHDKTNIVRLRPAWIQTSLRIRAVWSGSMLFAISFYTCKRVGKQQHGCWIHAGRKRTMLVLSWCGSYIFDFSTTLLLRLCMFVDLLVIRINNSHDNNCSARIF
jgi:hypothetical protein